MDAATFTSHRKTVTTDGGEIAYTEFGSGPVALFVHGVGLNGLLWRNVIEQVSDTSRCIAIDLPLHGGTPTREDLSVTAMAGVVADLCAALGLDQVDLVANDTGGAVAQVFAAEHPEILRTVTLTNCDSEGNLPPEAFKPVVEAAAQGILAETLLALAGDLDAARKSPFGGGFENPERLTDDVLGAYLTPVAGTLDRAREFERMLAALEPSHLDAVGPKLRGLDVPTLIVWGTGDEAFGVEWAYRLRDTILGAHEVVEVAGGKVFFPEERPDDLVPHLRRFWSR